MKFTAILIAAVAAVSVSAAPEMGHPRCHGDMEFDPFQKLCKCDKGEYYDAEIKRCRIKEVKEVRIRECREGEKLYCVRGENDFVPYDRKSPYCWDDKHSKVICAKKNRVSEVFKHEIRKEYEVAHISVNEHEHKRLSCHRPRFYNYESKQCECPKNKIWNGHGCGFPLLPKPTCGHREKAYCAKNVREVVVYEKTEKLCEDNGKYYVFCCDGGEKKHRHYKNDLAKAEAQPEAEADCDDDDYECRERKEKKEKKIKEDDYAVERVDYQVERKRLRKERLKKCAKLQDYRDYREERESRDD